MEIKKELQFTEEYLPTPRHRKLRTRIASDEFFVTISETTSASAPVVLRTKTWQHAGGQSWTKDTEYRQYNGVLFTPLFGDIPFGKRKIYAHLSAREMSARLKVPNAESKTKEAVAQEFQKYADRYLIIDGAAWERANEPFYAVETNKHYAAPSGEYISVVVRQNGFCADDKFVFSALQKEEAYLTAKAMAERIIRNETTAHMRAVVGYDSIDVLDPSVIRFEQKPQDFAVEVVSTRKVTVTAQSYTQAVEAVKKLPVSILTETSRTYHPNEIETKTACIETENFEKALDESDVGTHSITDEVPSLLSRYGMEFACDAKSCALNPNGICLYPLLYGTMPDYEEGKTCADFSTEK